MKFSWKLRVFLNFAILENESETEFKMNKQKEEAFVTFHLWKVKK